MIEEKIICAGFGGQGVMLMGQLLAYAANEKNLNTLGILHNGPETRGGTANCSITYLKPPSIHQLYLKLILSSYEQTFA